MEQVLVYLILVLVGLCMGSFAGATVWRLRARQLVQDNKAGEKVDLVEYKRLNKLTKNSLMKDHSVCLNCSYKLKWYDLIPLISWISLGGRCRKCRKPIGYFEPLLEIGVGLFFVLSYAFWPNSINTSLEITQFVIWLASGVGLAILFAYDYKWSILPDIINYVVIGLGLISALLVIASSTDRLHTLINIVGSVAILSGLYLLIYIVSSGKWIGFGDVKLCLGMSLLLADWQLAFIALFASNFIGSLAVMPGLITKKLKGNSHVPFGPLLIAGFVFAGLFGPYIVNLYQHLTF
ncbi:MAG TPA: prepilin peptidase [Candidatus Saccharimonadales bacterium]|nr:prepilin peptidase [Candidatus Saccharimonadales bacterium]